MSQKIFLCLSVAFPQKNKKIKLVLKKLLDSKIMIVLILRLIKV